MSASELAPIELSPFWSVAMSFPSVVQSLLALYGFGDRANTPRRRPAPVLIGGNQPRR